MLRQICGKPKLLFYIIKKGNIQLNDIYKIKKKERKKVVGMKYVFLGNFFLL